MPLIEAFLALALTMLSLSMIATLFVEFFHHLFRTRTRDLKAMLVKFYDDELTKIVEREQRSAGEGSAALPAKKDFIAGLTENPLLRKEKISALNVFRRPFKRFDIITSVDLVRYLARTDLGHHIKEKAELEIDEFVETAARAYERFGAAATDLFKRRARMISIVGGLIVAFVLNVNAIDLFRTYLDDPQTRARVVAQADEIVKRFEEKQAGGELKGFESREDLDAFVGECREEIDGLARFGIEFGYREGSAPEIYRSEVWRGGTWAKVKGLLIWLVSVFGTGLLIGLGGPFWFNIVRKLTSVIQGMRGGGDAGDREDKGGREESAPAPARADPIAACREAFKKSDGFPTAVKIRMYAAAAAELRAAGIEPDGPPPAGP